jgi:hypothetical protein
MLKVTQFYVGFEILTAVTMKREVFCDVEPCSPIEVLTFRNNVLPATLLAVFLLLVACLPYPSTLRNVGELIRGYSASHFRILLRYFQFSEHYICSLGHAIA